MDPQYVNAPQAESWQSSITSEYRVSKQQEIQDNFPKDNGRLAIGGSVGPQQCAQTLEESAFNSAKSREDYDQKISQCIQTSQDHRTTNESLLAQLERLNVGCHNSQPRAMEQGSSSSSTNGQAAAPLQPRNQDPGIRSPSPQQVQQQNQVPVHIQQAQVENTLEPVKPDRESTRVSPVEFERDEVWAKLQNLNVKYLQDMNELYTMLTFRSNQPMPAEQLQKLKHYKDVLHRMIPYLRVPKERVPKEFNMEKVEAFEKQITSIMDTFKRRRNHQPDAGNDAPAVAGVQVN